MIPLHATNANHDCYEFCIISVCNFIKPTTTPAEFDAFLNENHPNYSLQIYAANAVNPVVAAAIDGNDALLCHIVAKSTFQDIINHPTHWCRTPLLNVISLFGMRDIPVSIIRTLIRLGADVNKATTCHVDDNIVQIPAGSNPLSMTLTLTVQQTNNIENLQKIANILLLKKDAELGQVDEALKMTNILLAKEKDLKRVVKLLVRKGANSPNPDLLPLTLQQTMILAAAKHDVEVEEAKKRLFQAGCRKNSETSPFARLDNDMRRYLFSVIKAY